MTARQFEEIGREYERIAHEHLVADAEWVGPLYEMCAVAVGCDPSIDAVETETDAEAEIVTRTAAVIAVMTHGVKAVRR